MPPGFVVWKGSKRRGRLSGRSPVVCPDPAHQLRTMLRKTASSEARKTATATLMTY
jgi:hypothetical protein